MNIIEQIRNRKFAIFILILLIASIPFMVMVALKQQEIRTRAGGGSVQFQLIPQSLSKNPGDIFSVDVSIDAGTFSLSGLNTNITIDKDIVDFVSFNPASAFDQIIINSYSLSTGILRITAVDVEGPASTGIVKIGTLTLKAKSVGTAHVNFLNSQAVGLGQDTPLPIREAINGTYTFIVPSPTPTTPPPPTTPTPTPTPAADCVKKPPTVSYEETFMSGEPKATVTYNIKLKGEDSSEEECPSRVITLDLVFPSNLPNWTYTPKSVTLGPTEEKTVALKVTSGPNASPGIKSLVLKVGGAYTEKDFSTKTLEYKVVKQGEE